MTNSWLDVLGSIEDLEDAEFDVELVRHLESKASHVEDRPIRASRASAEWCLRGVEQCWTQKERFYASEEQEEARAAYDHARNVYRERIEERPEGT